MPLALMVNVYCTSKYVVSSIKIEPTKQGSNDDFFISAATVNIETVYKNGHMTYTQTLRQKILIDQGALYAVQVHRTSCTVLKLLTVQLLYPKEP